MKKTFIIIMTAISLLLSAGISLAADVNMQAGVGYDWWDDNKDNKGSQFYVPLSIQAQMKDFSFGLLSAYTYTEAEPDGFDSRSLSTILDTKLTTSYQVTGKLPVDVLVGVDFNLPTGKTNLDEKDLIVIMDPDLVTVTNFGEGFNVNPLLVVAKQMGKWVVGIGTGYNWRGEYDYSKDIGMGDYDPGDLFNINGDIRYYFSQSTSARFFTGYIWYGEDEVDGDEFYQEGDLFLFGLGFSHVQKQWDAGITLKGIFRNKSKIIDDSGDLSSEDENSHGDEYDADIYFRYLLNDKTALKTSLEGLLITENDYSSDQGRYIGQRERLALGCGVTRVLGEKIEAGLDLKGFIMHDDDWNYPEPRSSRDYKGFSAVVSVKASF